MWTFMGLLYFSKVKHFHHKSQSGGLTRKSLQWPLVWSTEQLRRWNSPFASQCNGKDSDRNELDCAQSCAACNPEKSNINFRKWKHNIKQINLMARCDLLLSQSPLHINDFRITNLEKHAKKNYEGFYKTHCKRVINQFNEHPHCSWRANQQIWFNLQYGSVQLEEKEVLLSVMWLPFLPSTMIGSILM